MVSALSSLLKNLTTHNCFLKYRQDYGGQFEWTSSSLFSEAIILQSRSFDSGEAAVTPCCTTGVRLTASVRDTVLHVYNVCIVTAYSGVKELLIAVLHPRVISVYKLTSKDDQPVLSLVHSHPLSHTAHSMVVGPFGRATGVYYIFSLCLSDVRSPSLLPSLSLDQEMVCILSMDGQLCVVDHTGIIVTCYLPNFILPGPLAYTAHTDCLVTVSSARQLEVYRYQSVCMASTAMENDSSKQSSGSGRKLLVC